MGESGLNLSKLFGNALEAMTAQKRANPHLIQAGVDFFRTYADRTHHGKEEDILFRELKNKSLSPDHETIMNQLIQEHVQAREAVGKLSDANDRYLQDYPEALPEMIHQMQKLVKLYPPHIEKEDKHFFIPILNYFSDEEQQAMLEAFRKGDAK